MVLFHIHKVANLCCWLQDVTSLTYTQQTIFHLRSSSLISRKKFGQNGWHQYCSYHSVSKMMFKTQSWRKICDIDDLGFCPQLQAIFEPWNLRDELLEVCRRILDPIYCLLKLLYINNKLFSNLTDQFRIKSWKIKHKNPIRSAKQVGGFENPCDTSS